MDDCQKTLVELSTVQNTNDVGTRACELLFTGVWKS
jgi:hypothetical protein